MRPTHIRLVAVAGVLAVAIGVATAFVVARDDPAQPAAAPTPTTIAAIEPADTNDRTDPAPTPTTRPPVRDEQAAKATAVAFLRELGMRDPVAATYRRTGAATAEVGLHPKAGEGGRPFEKVTTSSSSTATPTAGSPPGPRPSAHRGRPAAALRPRPLAAHRERPVRVLRGHRARHRHRGPARRRPRARQGLRERRRDRAGALPGRSVRQPHPRRDAGWVVFSGDTGADTGIIQATAVRVRFVTSDHRPQILGVSTNPPASGSARLVTLTGSGTLGVKVKAFGADEVRVLLVPSGTDARSHAKLLGVDTTAGADGESWSVSWRYPDQSFHGHLLIQVNGRGGTAEHDGIAVLHT